MNGTYSVIRRANIDDRARVERAAKRFCERHGIEIYNPAAGAEDAIWDAIEREHYEGYGNTKKLWIACFRRAVKSPRATSIRGDSIGYWVK